MLKKLAAAGALVAFVMLPTLAFAQAVIAAPPSPWNGFLAAIEPTLITFAGIVFTALGVIITKFVTDHFGASTGMLASQAYQMASDAAAGWLKTFLDAKFGATGTTTAKIGEAPTTMVAAPLTVNSPEVKQAVTYMKDAFPDAIKNVRKATGNPVGDNEIASDILGAFGKLAPGPIGNVAGIVAAVLKPRPV